VEVVVRPDSTLWRNFSSGVRRGAATSEVTRISVHHGTRDIAKGGMKGILIGTVCGGLFGSMLATTDDGEFIDLTITQGAVAFGVLGAGAGGLVGLLAGNDEKIDHYEILARNAPGRNPDRSESPQGHSRGQSAPKDGL